MFLYSSQGKVFNTGLSRYFLKVKGKSRGFQQFVTFWQVCRQQKRLIFVFNRGDLGLRFTHPTSHPRVPFIGHSESKLIEHSQINQVFSNLISRKGTLQVNQGVLCPNVSKSRSKVVCWCHSVVGCKSRKSKYKFKGGGIIYPNMWVPGSIKLSYNK